MELQLMCCTGVRNYVDLSHRCPALLVATYRIAQSYNLTREGILRRNCSYSHRFLAVAVKNLVFIESPQEPAHRYSYVRFGNKRLEGPWFHERCGRNGIRCLITESANHPPFFAGGVVLL